MEQQNKYYTPDAGDIYPGYEYEFNGNKENYESVGEWFKNIAGTEPEECSILDQWGLQDGKPSNWYIQQGWIRTKYLDQEDIESLGWTDVKEVEFWMGKPPMYIWSAQYKNMMMAYNPEDHTLAMMPRDPTRNPQNTTDEYNYPEIKYGMFRGLCKSKNELRKIMQWVGIS